MHLVDSQEAYHLFMQDGYLVYEYNLFEIKRTVFRSAEPIGAGDGGD